MAREYERKVDDFQKSGNQVKRPVVSNSSLMQNSAKPGAADTDRYRVNCKSNTNFFGGSSRPLANKHSVPSAPSIAASLASKPSAAG